MAGQRTRIKKEAKAKADVDDFMAALADDDAPLGSPRNPMPRQRRPAGRKSAEWACTAAEIEGERAKGLSWANIARNLNLANPGQARRAYTELTGKPHNESGVVAVRRTKHRSLSTGTRRKVHAALQWNDDTDQDEMEAKLNGEWIEEIGDPAGKNYVPAHWSGSIIVVEKHCPVHEDTDPECKRCRLLNQGHIEELRIRHATEFSFGKDGSVPLTVTVIGKDDGAFHSFYVANIREVR